MTSTMPGVCLLRPEIACPAVPRAEAGQAAGAIPGCAEASDGPLCSALVESRSRWRELVGLAADLAFETDPWGRFVFVSPDPALGWPAATLLGQPAELLLARVEGAPGFNPFRPLAAVRGRRAWLRRPDASSLCIAFAAAPLLDAKAGSSARAASARKPPSRTATTRQSPARSAGSSCWTTSSGGCARKSSRRG